MERKYQIRPVTILKVKGFLQDVTLKIKKGERFSMDALATEHSVSGSMGTALARMGYIKQSPERHGVYLIVKNFMNSEKMAVQILEFIRIRNIQMKKDKEVMSHTPLLMDVPILKDHSEDVSSKTGNDFTLKTKSLKSPEINPYEEAKPKGQINIFEGIKNSYEERLSVCSAVATGVYSGVCDSLHHMSEEDIKSLNQKILMAAMDLIDQTLNYKSKQ